MLKDYAGFLPGLVNLESYLSPYFKFKSPSGIFFLESRSCENSPNTRRGATKECRPIQYSKLDMSDRCFLSLLQAGISKVPWFLNLKSPSPHENNRPCAPYPNYPLIYGPPPRSIQACLYHFRAMLAYCLNESWPSGEVTSASGKFTATYNSLLSCVLGLADPLVGGCIWFTKVSRPNNWAEYSTAEIADVRESAAPLKLGPPGGYPAISTQGFQKWGA